MDNHIEKPQPSGYRGVHSAFVDVVSEALEHTRIRQFRTRTRAAAG